MYIFTRSSIFIIFSATLKAICRSCSLGTIRKKTTMGIPTKGEQAKLLDPVKIYYSQYTRNAIDLCDSPAPRPCWLPYSLLCMSLLLRAHQNTDLMFVNSVVAFMAYKRSW